MIIIWGYLRKYSAKHESSVCLQQQPNNNTPRTKNRSSNVIRELVVNWTSWRFDAVHFGLSPCIELFLTDNHRRPRVPEDGEQMTLQDFEELIGQCLFSSLKVSIKMFIWSERLNPTSDLWSSMCLLSGCRLILFWLMLLNRSSAVSLKDSLGFPTWAMLIDSLTLICNLSSIDVLSRPVAKGGHFGAMPPCWSGVPPRWMFPPECLPLSAPPLNSPRWVPPGECPPAECRPPSAPSSPPTSPVEFVKLRRLPPLEFVKPRRLPPPRIRKTSPTTPPSNS